MGPAAYLLTCLHPSSSPRLDSTASYSLVAALHDISRSGVTAAAVVHQPSWPCCRLFDHLVLLGKGGRTGEGQCGVCRAAALVLLGRAELPFLPVQISSIGS